LKPYDSPKLCFPYLLSEGAKREWLAQLLLQPGENAVLNRFLYALLFETERDAVIKNCLLMRREMLQAYCVDLYAFTRDVLQAVREKLPRMTLQTDGYPFAAAIYPRPLQMALVCLCRCFFETDFTVNMTVTHRNFQVSVHSPIPLIWNEQLRTASLVATAHEGRLITSGNTAILQFPPNIKTTAVPRWLSPGTDGLLRDPLSFVNIGFYDSDFSVSQPDANTQ
jgi:hypothetical protein